MSFLDLPRLRIERQHWRQNFWFYLGVIVATWAGASLFFVVLDLVRGWPR